MPRAFLLPLLVSTGRGLFLRADGEADDASQSEEAAKLKQSWYKCGVKYLQSAASVCNNNSVDNKV